MTPIAVGTPLPPVGPYEVSAAKLQEFAAAVGDTSPVPPTFTILLCARALDAVRDAVGGATLIHRGQRFRYHGTVRAGQRLMAFPAITELKEINATTVALTVHIEITTVDHTPICDATSLLALVTPEPPPDR